MKSPQAKNPTSLREQYPKAFRLLTEEMMRRGRPKAEAEKEAELEIEARLEEGPDPTDHLY